MLTAAASTAGAAARAGGGATRAAGDTPNAVMATTGPGHYAISSGEHTGERRVLGRGLGHPRFLRRGRLVAFEPPEGRGPRSRPRSSAPSRNRNPWSARRIARMEKEDEHEHGTSSHH